jgi:hypothetical protein
MAAERVFAPLSITTAEAFLRSKGSIIPSAADKKANLLDSKFFQNPREYGLSQ